MSTIKQCVHTAHRASPTYTYFDLVPPVRLGTLGSSELTPAWLVSSYGNTFLPGDTNTRQVLQHCSPPCFPWPTSPSFPSAGIHVLAGRFLDRRKICPTILNLCSTVMSWSLLVSDLRRISSLVMWSVTACHLQYTSPHHATVIKIRENLAALTTARATEIWIFWSRFMW